MTTKSPEEVQREINEIDQMFDKRGVQWERFEIKGGRRLPQIISVGYAVPLHETTQEEIFKLLGYPSIFWPIFRDAGIDKRYFALRVDKLLHLTWQEQQEEYVRGALPLSLQAIQNCLDGRDVSQVGCLTYSTCTGFLAGPTMPHFIVRAAGLGPRTDLTNIGGMGCEGAFPGLKRAADYTMASGTPSLVVACELCSCTYYPETFGQPDPYNHHELLRSNALFADAAVCALVGYDDDWRHPAIVDTETYTRTDFMDDLGFRWFGGRIRVVLSKRVPELAPQVVKPAVDAVLGRHELKPDNITWWVIHAAGKTVIDNIRDALGIGESKVELSRGTLKLYGNTSSTSVGITGKRLMSQDIMPGDWAVMISVGPGLSGGATLLRFGGGDA